tara:strand:+ start:211 stop:336 length:126 start_codon:yes stop_codon:yes gene_type:complete
MAAGKRGRSALGSVSRVARDVWLNTSKVNSKSFVEWVPVEA